MINIDCLAGRLISEKGSKWPASRGLGNPTRAVVKLKLKIRIVYCCFIAHRLQITGLKYVKLTC